MSAETDGQTAEEAPPEEVDVASPYEAALARINALNETVEGLQDALAAERDEKRAIAERVDELETTVDRLDQRTDPFRFAGGGGDLTAKQRHYLLLEAAKRKARNREDENVASLDAEDARTIVDYADDADRTLPNKDLLRTADRFSHEGVLAYQDGRLRINLDAGAVTASSSGGDV